MAIVQKREPPFPKALNSQLSIINSQLTYLALSSSIAAWAAARRATGTRNGEQLT